MENLQIKSVYNNGITEIVVLRGGLTSENPKEFMDNAVRDYVGNRLHNQFIEAYNDMPYTRVIIFNLNEVFD